MFLQSVSRGRDSLQPSPQGIAQPFQSLFGVFLYFVTRIFVSNGTMLSLVAESSSYLTVILAFCRFLQLSVSVFSARLPLVKGECKMLVRVLCGFMFLLLPWVDLVRNPKCRFSLSAFPHCY